MDELSLHILDIVENSINADASKIEIIIEDNAQRNILAIIIEDNGRGMNNEILKMVDDPFFTTKGKKVGLGIPLLKQSTIECEGSFSIKSIPGKGTTINATFRRDHIDRKKIGNLTSTLMTIIAGHPDIVLSLSYKITLPDEVINFYFNTRDIKKNLGDIPINTPPVLKFIKEYLSQELGRLEKITG